MLGAVWTANWGRLVRGALRLGSAFTWVCTISSACTDSDTVNIVVRDGRDPGHGGDALDASGLNPAVVDSSLPNAMTDVSAGRLDASADADASDGSACCPPSPQPDCCMVYGGHDGNDPSKCGVVICDNMPLPSAPWQLGVDDHGCPRWIEPEATNECCGCPADGGLPL
jgi:hypothetical protein